MGEELPSASDREVSANLTMSHQFELEKKVLKLSMKVEIGGADMPFALSIEGGSLFVFDNVVTDANDLRKVAEVNCAAITFPYVRELVSETIRRAGFPPLNLPPMNFVELYKKNHPEP
ncbi:protein-export chaperone SecB [Geomonas subterranea]|uniref:Protein-export chaperone SecB n=1 Tax=Geomonas subterranea TaxID=2847989 RepID=A0ABX8LD47_9BACT|nr:protein-export chaperone SecB [Geomonas subterranea]QXE89961.1 protein-export chaperone SecB [Geomonas subterranea]QXM07920.1 protein-export chaperone SecB [Geomonas subterranea]